MIKIGITQQTRQTFHINMEQSGDNCFLIHHCLKGDLLENSSPFRS